MSSKLWQVWKNTVSDGPDLPALIDARTGDSLTRSQLHQNAEKLAAKIHRGAKATIAFAEPNGPEWFQVFLAIQKLGAVALPMDVGLPRTQREDVAVKLGASFLFRSVNPETLTTLDPEPGPMREEACLLKVTSGTLGAPRALPFTANQMIADGQQVCEGMGILPRDLNFGSIPLGHSYGLGNLVMPLLNQGTPIAWSSEMLPGGVAEGIALVGATVLPTVPTMLRGLGESPSVVASDLASLRLVISAGAFLRPDVATTFYGKFRCSPHSFYGSSETGGICYDRDGQATLSGRSVGTPLPLVRVNLDPDQEHRVRVESPAVTDPGMHLLPDRGEWNSAGELCLLGRAGAVANVGGRKVDPADVERALRTLSQVKDAWVGVRTRAGGDDYLVAAVETPLARGDVLKSLNELIPPWQVPRQVIAVSLLPRTERGKLHRVELEKWFS